MKNLITLVLVLGLVVSCKETVKTPGQITADQINCRDTKIDYEGGDFCAWVY